MTQSVSEQESVFAGFHYDEHSASIMDSDGRAIKLRPQTVDVFKVLAESPDQLVTRERLLSSVWSGVKVTDDSLTKCISEIRKAIGDKNHDVLQTVPKRGYVLVSGTPSPAHSKKNKNTNLKQSKWSLLANSNITLIAAAVCFLLAGLFIFQRSNWHSDTTIEQPSIAVIPFSSNASEARWRRMAEGFGSNILAEFARNDWLRVYQIKSHDELQRYIDDGNAIQFVLDGTFQGIDETLRVTAKLQDTFSKEIVWSGHWKQPVDDLFLVQDEIVARIGNSMGSAWSGVLAQHSLQRARRRPTENLSAYEFYLLGNEHKHRFNEDDYKLAIRYLEKAVAIDPTFGKAWASLAIVHALRTDPTNSEKGRHVILEDRLYATRKAIEADPEDPDVMIQLSWLTHHQGDSAESERALRNAVNAAPNNADLLAQAAWAGPERADVGVDAVQWAKRAIELNPGHPSWYLTGLLTAAFHAEDYQLVLAVADRAPETLARFTYEAAAAIQVDDDKRARAVVKKIMKLNPGFSIDTYDKTDPIRNSKVREKFQVALRKAGVPQFTLEPASKIKTAG